MLELKALGETQVRLLYALQMKRDFPQSELKGLGAIVSLMRAGVYDVLALYDGGELTAYALVYRPREGRVLLLDYLAVEPQLRGRGLGGELLRCLRAHYADRADALMIECERPKAAPDMAAARRRIRFYEHAGAWLTRVRLCLFEVEYSIMVLPCGDGVEREGKDWAEQMLSLYRQMLPPGVYARNVRLIRS